MEHSLLFTNENASIFEYISKYFIFFFTFHQLNFLCKFSKNIMYISTH